MGRFGVGTFTEKLFDPSRTTPATAGGPERQGRTLIVTVLYPATSVAPGRTVTGASPDRTHGPYPLIVFAHGLGSSPFAYATLLSAWASAGYVVAAPLFPGTSVSTPGGPDIADYVNQPADMSFVISSVLRLWSAPPAQGVSSADRLAGLVDPHLIGAVGHSLGGVTVLGLVTNSCCRDDRVRAVVSIAGDALTFPSGNAEYRGAPPLLLVHGNADATVPYTASVDVFDQAVAPKGLLTIHGGGHSAAVDPTSPAYLAVVATTTDFFDLYLKSKGAALARLEAAGQSSNTSLAFAASRGEGLTVPVPRTTTGHRHATVIPAGGLTDEETVIVSWTGFQPGIPVNVLECSKSPPRAAQDCDLKDASLGRADPRGQGSLPFVIHTGPVGSALCDATHQRCVIVVNEGGSSALQDNAIVPIGFG